MKAQKGMILLTVLIFLSLFSLMSWQALNTAALSHKENRHDWEKFLMVANAETQLSKIENAFIQTLPLCILPTPMPILKKPLSWWKKSGCADKVADLECYYVAQALGEDGCSYTKIVNNHLISADYYKITLFCWTGFIQDPQLMLQTTVIRDGHISQSCSGKLHQVTVGRQVLIYTSL